MCMKKILAWWNRQPAVPVPPPASDNPPDMSNYPYPLPVHVPLTVLPHPENTINAATDDREATLEAALVQWHIPEVWHPWWKSIPTELVVDYQYPASWQDADGNPLTMQDQVIKFHQHWDTPGVCIHEMGHVSWEFLTSQEKQQFANLHDFYKDKDPYLKLLYSINTYGLTNPNEAHSEWLRYIGIEYMPVEVRKFYPRMV